LLDEEQRTCLVHSDLNPKNLLLDPESLEVTGVLDWEFAHAGHPFTDLGNLVRFERMPAYVDGLLAAYTERHGGEEHLAEATARAADLWALVDLAARAGDNPVADRAAALLREIARTGHLHGTPY
jgi:aminoglycoside phosphotransferase (APT) family kinase protein